MAEAVAKTLVAVATEVAVDVFFPGRHELVDPGGVGGPGQVEILPEGRRAEIEHATPVGAEQLERRVDLVGPGQGLEHVQAVEGGNSLPAAGQKHVAGRFLRALHAREHQERGPRLRAVGLGHHPLGPGGRRATDPRHAVVAEHVHQPPAALERHHEQPLQARCHALLIG